MIQYDSFSIEEKSEALAKALKSKTFARSEQLRAFLRYVCEAEMRPGAHVTEYTIGVDVLGRHEGYSTAEDSSVRTRAYELRQRLEKLYSAELPNEPVQITLPKGSYTPLYVRREESSPKLQEQARYADERAFITVQQRLRSRRLLTVGLVLSALLGSLATWLILTTGVLSGDGRPEAVLAEAWGPLATRQGTVLLSTATPLSLVVGPADHDVFGSKNYPAPPETYGIFSQHRLLPADTRLGLTFSDNMVAVGTMNAVLMCANTLRRFGSSYQLLPERVATTSALRNRNSIILGAPIDGKTIAVAMQEMPLLVDFEPSVREFVIRDKATGGITAPKKDPSGDMTEVYGLLTVQNERDTEGNRVQTVLLSGITSVGTQGAAEFFSSASAMSDLRARLTNIGGHTFPASYQVVVRCTCSNLLLLSYSYYTHRTVRQEL